MYVLTPPALRSISEFTQGHLVVYRVGVLVQRIPVYLLFLLIRLPPVASYKCSHLISVFWVTFKPCSRTQCVVGLLWYCRA